MAGNRLPGDSEGSDRHKADERAETRLSGTLLERFETFRDDHGISEAQLLRDSLDDYLPESETSEYVVPIDPDLRNAYLTLARPGEKRKLTVSQVESILCNTSHPNTPKELIKDDVLEPLTESGLVGVKGGQVAVHPLTRKEDAFGEGDDVEQDEPARDRDVVADEWDRLDESQPVRADGGVQ